MDRPPRAAEGGSITPASSTAPSTGPAPSHGTAGPSRAGGLASSPFWSFLRTLLVGSVGLALLAVVGTLAGSAWLTANQRSEAQKPQPWADPSFTTTAVTTGGMLARWMDNDGNLDNGHSYIKGIYEIWKTRENATWQALATSPDKAGALPMLWLAEFNRDAEAKNKAIALEAEQHRNERQRMVEETRKKNLEWIGKM